MDRFPHDRLAVVDSIEDLDEQEVVTLPNSLGLWQVVDHFPDDRTQIVEALGDFKIRFVNSFPGPK